MKPHCLGTGNGSGLEPWKSVDLPGKVQPWKCDAAPEVRNVDAVSLVGYKAAGQNRNRDSCKCVYNASSCPVHVKGRAQEFGFYSETPCFSNGPVR